MKLILKRNNNNKNQQIYSQDNHKKSKVQVTTLPNTRAITAALLCAIDSKDMVRQTLRQSFEA